MNRFVLLCICFCSTLSPMPLLANETEKVLFEEKFQEKLQSGWTWMYEEETNWRLVPGKLQIRATGGSPWQGKKNGKNYLLRKPPQVDAGALAVEVFVENRPTEPFEHAGLWWYYDDDHYVTLNKEQFGGRQEVLFVVEKEGKGRPPYGQIPFQGEGVWLRLRVSGMKIEGQYRATLDEEWKSAGSRELPVRGEPQIGLHGGYAPKKETDRWASFSHFRVLQIGD